MKQDKVKYDFKAFGQAIKEARKAKGISRNQLADKLNIAPRYIASIENSGQHLSLQIFYELVTFLDVSVDQFFFPNVDVLLWGASQIAAFFFCKNPSNQRFPVL